MAWGLLRRWRDRRGCLGGSPEYPACTPYTQRKDCRYNPSQNHHYPVTPTGCSKRPHFSPAQPWLLFHPPTLSLPRQTLCPRTRLIPCEAAASYHFLRGGWDDPNCAQYSTHPALSAPRRALSRARAFLSFPLFRGAAKAALNCAHRTSTVSPCAFCAQGGHLVAPYPSSEAARCASTGIVPATPPIFQHPAIGPAARPVLSVDPDRAAN